MHALIRRTAALVAVAMLVVSVPFAASGASAATALAPTATVTTANLTSVSFPSASVGYAAGSDGTVIKTTDGGDSWVVVRNPDGLNFTGIAFWDASSGIAVSASQQVWGTNDGGSSWTQRNPAITNHGVGAEAVVLHGVAALPGSTIRASAIAGDVATGDLDWQGAQAWETYDNGAYWREAYEYKPSWYPSPADPDVQYGIGEYFGIDFVDGSNGWVVGVDYGPAGAIVPASAVARTTDGGVFWNPQTLSSTATLKAVSFASTLVGVTTGSAGRVFYTSNGGTSWTEGSSGVFVSLNGVGLTSATSGWAVGAGGTLIKTTNGGATWSSAVSPTSEDLLAVTFVGSAGWAVGNNGTIIRTTDGLTWEIPSGDTTGPTMTSLTSSTHASASAWYSNNDPAFSWGATDPSGVAGYSFVLDQSPSTSPTTATSDPATTTSYTNKADGTWYFHVRAVDTLGNWGAATHLAVNIDTAAPSMTSLTSSTHASATTWYSNNDPAFSWGASDTHAGVSGYSYELDQAAATTPDTTSEGAGTTASFTDKADGVWYFHVRARDAAGNWGTASHREVRIDVAPPTMTSITSSTHSTASTWYSNNDPALAWSASDSSAGVTGYSYELDQIASTTPDTVSEGSGSTTSYTNRTDGLWYFHVRALDAAGNWGTAMHREVRIDTAPPTTTDDHDAVYTGPATITLTPTDAHSGVAQTYYALDGVPGTGTTVNASTAGDYTLEYASADNAGNRETTVTVNFTIDLTAPSIVSLASSTHPLSATWYANNDPSFSWSVSDPGNLAGYSYVLDQSAATIPDETSEGSGATASFTDKADGLWYFHVRAVNSSGTWGSTSHLAVRIDTLAPTVVSLTSSTHASTSTWYSNNDPAFAWSASDAGSGVSGYSYVLDQSATTTPDTTSEGSGTSASFTDRADGVWYMHVRAVDSLGAWSTTSHLAVRIDTTLPTMGSLTSSTHASPSTWYMSNDPAFAWSADDAGSGVTGYSYVLDQIAATTPDTTSEGSGTSYTASNKSDGTWYMHVRAVDAAGNWSAVSHRTVLIDTAPPLTTAESSVIPGSGTVTLSSFDVHSGVAGISWSVVGGASGVGSTVTLTGAGTYTVNYRATDLAGNQEAQRSIQVVVPPVVPGALIVTPIAGSNRIETAILASQEAFPTGATTVVIATGFNWPDALGGAALAGALDGPILLTDPSALSSAVMGEITRLGATHAVVLGGPGAVSTAVENALKADLGAANVRRVAGANRYETARKIAEATVAEVGAGYDGTAFVATGANFPDALGASPLAAANGWPIYLVDPRGADAALVASMQTAGVTDAITLGGTGAVSAAIQSDLAARVPCDASVRLAGGDRYDTARVVATYGVTSAGLGWDKVAIATGQNFPDALAGGVLQGATGSVMLLTPGTTLYPGVASTLSANKAAIAEVRFLGGTGAVSTVVRNAVIAALH